jgi:hypothetical protein
MWTDVLPKAAKQSFRAKRPGFSAEMEWKHRQAMRESVFVCERERERVGD